MVSNYKTETIILHFKNKPQIIMNLTHAQRFDRVSYNFRLFAPLSNGCPSMIHAIDRKAFKKTDEEKGKLITLKQGITKSRVHKFKSIAKMDF